MQPGSRRGDGAFLVRKQCLIVGAVLRVRRPAARDIGRQRHLAALRDRLVEHWAVKSERERDLAALAFFFNGCIQLVEETHFSFIPEPDYVAHGELAGRLGERTPARAIDALDQGRLDLRLAGSRHAPAGQARSNDLGVVDDDLIARRQQGRQIGNGPVVEFRHACRTHDQKPRVVARLSGTQRNAFGRKLEIEQIGAHGGSRESADTPLVGCCPPTSDAPPPRTHDLIWAFKILSGLITGSPRLILSTFSMPSVTVPQTVYWPLRNGASAKQMKN